MINLAGLVQSGSIGDGADMPIKQNVNVREFGAVGKGEIDESSFIQRALDSGAESLRLPAGLYLIGETLRVGSNTHLFLEPEAHIRLMDNSGTGVGVFLLTNKDHQAGNEDILIEGGIWDGNNPGNPRGPDGPTDSYTGVAINFVNVDDLSLRNLTVRDPESFFIRLGEIRKFLIEDITFEAPHTRLNHDAVHVGGFCEDGVIRRLRAFGVCCPNDDMVAINANDDVTRAINLGMKEGPIRRIKVEDISAEDAYTFVRILSQDAAIEDVDIRKIRGGCRYYALNLNRWRFPIGKGKINRVRIGDIDVNKISTANSFPLIHITLQVLGLEVYDFKRSDKTGTEAFSLELNNGIASEVILKGLSSSQLSVLNTKSTCAITHELENDTTDSYRVIAAVSDGDCLCLPNGGFSSLNICGTLHISSVGHKLCCRSRLP